MIDRMNCEVSVASKPRFTFAILLILWILT
jgi:hypothetical protein